ncbi:MAG: hypothetical protein GF393_07225, partial [Armatimonadia bacterium]|nr:hypothetical protein [Armatimonadia bacterium]
MGFTRIRLIGVVCTVLMVCSLCSAQPPVLIDNELPTLERPTTIEMPPAGEVIYDEPNPVKLLGDPRPRVEVRLDGKPLIAGDAALLADDKHPICDAWTLLKGLSAEISHADDWSWARGVLGYRHVVWHANESLCRTHERDIRTAATPQMVQGNLFIPLISTANNLGYKVDWDRQALTANIRTPTKATLRGFKITDHQVQWPVLRKLSNDYM